MIYEVRSLSLRAGPSAGPAQAVRHHHAQAVGKARHQAGRLLDDAGRRIQPGPELPARLGIAGEREKKWAAFQADPEWIAKRAETEKNGAIVHNVSNQLLVPTAFSSVK